MEEGGTEEGGREDGGREDGGREDGGREDGGREGVPRSNAASRDVAGFPVVPPTSVVVVVSVSAHVVEACG
jgi:hypothetical protein